MYSYGLQDMYDQAQCWINRHMTRVWGLKQFASLPDALRQKCLESAIADIVNIFRTEVFEKISKNT